MKADITTTAKVEFTVNLKLNEAEAKALDAIIGYGIQPFLMVFYPQMGEAYLKPHEKGAVSLFDHRQEISIALNKINEAKKVIAELNKITPLTQD